MCLHTGKHTAGGPNASHGIGHVSDLALEHLNVLSFGGAASCSHNLYMGEYSHMLLTVECDCSAWSGRCLEGAGRIVFLLGASARCSHNLYVVGGDYTHMVDLDEPLDSACVGRWLDGLTRHLLGEMFAHC